MAARLFFSSMRTLLLLVLQCLSLSDSFLVNKTWASTALRRAKASNAEENQTYETLEEKFNARWNVMFERLKAYKEVHGDCLVPTKYKDDPKLANWVSNQRQTASLDENIAKQRRDKLNSIGFVWSTRKLGRSAKLDKKWNEKFERLKEYKREYGDCLVPDRWPEDQALSNWVCKQRLVFANHKLRSDRRAQLESIGFAWKVGNSQTEYEKQWEDMFAGLQRYRETNGDCLVPTVYNEDPQLGTWVQTQRQRRSELVSSRRKRLESIGFTWNGVLSGAFCKQWDEMFAKLEKYRETHGDCNVPTRYKEDPKLGAWVMNQRQGRSELDSSRRKRLESIGFVWSVDNWCWDEMFAKLEKYRETRGDCLVPSVYKDDPQLGVWVHTQRQGRSELDSSRRKRLESIGFVWDAHDQNWENMFEKLSKYREAHGDCNVPTIYEADLELGYWVQTQRRRAIDKNLSPTQRERLESIGFVWQLKRGRPPKSRDESITQ